MKDDNLTRLDKDEVRVLNELRKTPYGEVKVIKRAGKIEFIEKTTKIKVQE